MYRRSTPRKTTALNVSAIDSNKFSAAFSASRADLDQPEACRNVLRMFATYAFLWLPVHCAISWLWAQSPGLAGAATFVIAIAVFLVAIAKWLGHEDLLQRLPLIVILGFGLVGIGFVSSRPVFSWFAGPDFFGVMFIVVTGISILSGLYRPLTAAYQAVTMKVPFRDLLATGAAVLASLALVRMATSMPLFAYCLIVGVAVGAYSGLVVIEYAAWARANPNLGLKRTMDFVQTQGTRTNQKDSCWRDPVYDVRHPICGAAFVGFGIGILTVFFENISSPSTDFRRFILWIANNQDEMIRDALGTIFLLGIFTTFAGFFVVASSLNAFKFADPVLALRLVWSALVIFLSYPESKNPLVHKFRIPWLRPVSVRLALTGLVLVAIATTRFQPNQPTSKVASGAAVAKTSSPPTPFRDRQEDDMARIFGAPQDDLFSRRIQPLPQNPSPAPQIEPWSEVGMPGFVAISMAVVIVPPAVVYLMIWMVGLTVLPNYFNYFELPEPLEPENEDGDLAAINHAKKGCAQ